jgi:Rps23 Pro-64 3,4-dihydroxylase Tpa1-like proline 4-hydroxylase
MTFDEVMDFSSVRMHSKPFTYFVAPRVFNARISIEVLDWLERGAPWKLIETDFYEQYEFSLSDGEINGPLALLQEMTYLEALRGRMEELFGTRLDEKIDMTVHKLVPGQRIRLHNDFIDGGETHRLLVQLNRGWTEVDGGFLLFFNSPDPADVHRVFGPVHNSAIGFAISPESNHAVSTVHEGERFTLVYSFYGKCCDS